MNQQLQDEWVESQARPEDGAAGALVGLVVAALGLAILCIA